MTQETGKNAALEVRGLEKVFLDHRQQRVKVVDGVSFRVDEGAFYTLLGPSGCGKTTTLRCVAGLERPEGGTVVIAGDAVSGGGGFVPPHKRDIGMVFQSYAIWPHMTVFDNVAFPLKVGKEKVSRGEIATRVGEVLDVVQLMGLEGRLATQLSGGQQQRLALARALVRRPKLLLLDEPLSNLDAKLRERMRWELKELQRRTGVTFVYVTHDQAEALSMSNRLAVLEQGKIVQEGTPREIYQRPASAFVANFVGATTFIGARVVDGRGVLETPLGDRPVTAACPPGVSAGDQVTLAIRPENVWVYPASTPAPDGTPNLYDGTVEQALFLGDMLDLRLQVGGTTLSARAHPTTGLRRGDGVRVSLPPEMCAVLSDTGVSAAQYVEREPVAS